MNKKNLVKALKILAEVQQDTAPIKLSIGATGKDNQVQNNELVLHDCCVSGIEALEKAGFSVQMCEEFGGLVVEDFGKEVE